MDIFGLNAWKLNTAATVYHKHSMPTVKHGGEEVIIWTLQLQDLSTLHSLNQPWSPPRVKCEGNVPKSQVVAMAEWKPRA